MLPLTHNNMPFAMAVSMGLVPDVRNIGIYGNIVTTNTTRKMVWELGGAVEDTNKFPLGAGIIYLSSDNAADISMIQVKYLDIDYAEITEYITLQGNIAVPLLTPCLRVNSATNISPLALQGNVYISSESAPIGGIPVLANTMEYIPADKGRTSSIAFTVPAGYSLLVTNFAGGNTRNEENDLRGSFTIGADRNFIFGLDIQLVSQYVDLEVNYFKVSEKSDIVATTKSENNNPDIVSGRLKGFLVKNTLESEF